MKRSEIWLINLNPTIGAELQKTRAGVIVNADGIGVLPLRVIVPLTSWQERYSAAPWMVKIECDTTNMLLSDSAADCLQVRSVSTDRLLRKIGDITPAQMQRIEAALKIVLNL